MEALMTAVSRPETVEAGPEPKTSDELVGLIRKLRWAGMEDDATRLQARLGRLTADDRSSVVAEPTCTD
jgi:hypothetical protein